MNKKEVFSHFSSILDDMLDTSLFFETFFQEPTSCEDIYGSIDDEAIPDNISIMFGATRGCVIDDNYDYVVKFDVENNDMYGSPCEREEYLYKVAQEEGLASYFAECMYLGTYTRTIQFYDYNKICRYISWYGYDCESFDEDFMANEDNFGEIHEIVISIPLYAYPKAEPHKFLRLESDNVYIAQAKKITSPMRDKNLAVAIDFVHQYGEEEYQRLSDFMYREDINDLHMANFGDVDNHYVCLDYSGFHDGCYESYDEE